MFEPVQPVPASPPSTGGLIRSAQVVNNPGERWEQGFAWRPERCPTARGFDPCGEDFEDPAVGAGSTGLAYYRPTALRVEDVCSTRRLDGDDARVRRQALAVTSFMVARELLTGAMSDANPYETPESAGVADQVNARLAGPDTQVEIGTFDPLHGLGVLEELARQDSLGMDVFVHVPISVMPLIDAALTREGQLLRTKTGALVVADAGYSNLGPDGNPAVGGVWAYATGPVQVRLSDVSTYRVVDHLTNEVTWTADRLFAATFDPCNVHALVLAVPASA
jgi:hypothetical protein